MNDGKQTQERLIEAAVALLDGAPGRRMQITNLNKALFYLDLVALRDTGKTITDNVYLAFERGPVMDGYKEKLIGALEKAGLARQDIDGMSEPVVLTGSLPSYHYMDDYLREKAGEVARKVASVTAGRISIESHKNWGWKFADARQKKNGSGTPQRINMFIAMQQLCDKDPWLAEPPDEEVNAAFAADPSGAELW